MAMHFFPSLSILFGIEFAIHYQHWGCKISENPAGLLLVFLNQSLGIVFGDAVTVFAPPDKGTIIGDTGCDLLTTTPECVSCASCASCGISKTIDGVMVTCLTVLVGLFSGMQNWLTSSRAVMPSKAIIKRAMDVINSTSIPTLYSLHSASLPLLDRIQLAILSTNYHPCSSTNPNLLTLDMTHGDWLKEHVRNE